MRSRMKVWKDKESGSSVSVVFILSLVLIVGVFGFGFDSLRAIHIQRMVQARLDSAAQAGVAVSWTNPTNGLVTLGAPTDSTIGTDGASALSRAYSTYYKNTQDKRVPEGQVLKCPMSPTWSAGTNTGTLPTIDTCSQKTAIVGAPLSLSELCASGSGTGTKEYGVRIAVNEQVDNTFLRIIAQDSFWLKNMKSVAKVRGYGC